MSGSSATRNQDGATFIRAVVDAWNRERRRDVSEQLDSLWEGFYKRLVMNLAELDRPALHQKNDHPEIIQMIESLNPSQPPRENSPRSLWTLLVARVVAKNEQDGTRSERLGKESSPLASSSTNTDRTHQQNSHRSFASVLKEEGDVQFARQIVLELERLIEAIADIERNEYVEVLLRLLSGTSVGTIAEAFETASCSIERKALAIHRIGESMDV